MGVFNIFRNAPRARDEAAPQSRASGFDVEGTPAVRAKPECDAFTEFAPSQYGDSLLGPLSPQSGSAQSSGTVQQEQRSRKRTNARPGTRVLIIDDSPALVRELRRMTRQNAFEPIEALGSERGLELAFSARPQLIFLGIALQGQSGFHVLRTLRRDERTRDIPIIMMSSNAQATEADYVRRMGADDFMTKPFSRADVFRRIERLLDPALVPRRNV